ncbi:MAG: hypothetical protein WC369_01970 [Dehalococcoidales bacterium]|jgi:hypothetical protein
MHTLTFIIMTIFALIAALTFSISLGQIARGNPKARNTMATGLAIGLVGVLVAAVLFGVSSP